MLPLPCLVFLNVVVQWLDDEKTGSVHYNLNLATRLVFLPLLHFLLLWIFLESLLFSLSLSTSVSLSSTYDLSESEKG